MKDNERFTFDNLEVRSNYDDKWLKNSIENPYDFIWIHRKLLNQSLELSLKDAEFIVNSLQQLINYIKLNTPQVNNIVKIVSGKFEGYEGKIFDTDTCDNNRPIAIKIHEKDLDGTVYVNFDEIEKINN